MPGKVKVKIISGRNLPVMDRSSDTTDAYVEIKLGSTTYKTDVCRKSLHPKWNSEWYRFEVDDSELQDEPLQIRLMDHDTYSANDAIGKVYIDLNPLLLPAANFLLKYNWNGETSSGRESSTNSVMSGWVPVYDTMHGIRGEVNITVKVELFSDSNKFRQSSCGVQFFCSKTIPHGYYAQVIHGFVEELVVNDDPEYQWIDKIRTPRASNEARQTLFFKLSGELQRKIGLKALDLGGNAVIGYSQCFDLEGESGIVARGIGTAVTLVKLLDQPAQCNAEATNDERSLEYLKFLGYNNSFRLNAPPDIDNLLSPFFYKRPLLVKQNSIDLYVDPVSHKRKQFTRHLSHTDFNSTHNSTKNLQHSSSLQTLLEQEDNRGIPGHGISQRIKNLKYTSQNMLSKKMEALKAKLGDSTTAETSFKSHSLSELVEKRKKPSKFKHANSDSSVMAELLVRSVIQAQNSLDCILEVRDNSSPSPQLQSDDADNQKELLFDSKPKTDTFHLSLPHSLDLQSSNESCSEYSSSEEDENLSDTTEANVDYETVSSIVKKVPIIERKLSLRDRNFTEPKFEFLSNEIIIDNEDDSQLVDNDYPVSEVVGNDNYFPVSEAVSDDNQKQENVGNIITYTNCEDSNSTHEVVDVTYDNSIKNQINDKKEDPNKLLPPFAEAENFNIDHSDEENRAYFKLSDDTDLEDSTKVSQTSLNSNKDDISDSNDVLQIPSIRNKRDSKLIIPPVMIGATIKSQGLVKTAMQTMLLEKVNIMGTYSPPMSPTSKDNHSKPFSSSPPGSIASSVKSGEESFLAHIAKTYETVRKSPTAVSLSEMSTTKESVLGAPFVSMHNIQIPKNIPPNSLQEVTNSKKPNSDECIIKREFDIPERAGKSEEHLPKNNTSSVEPSSPVINPAIRNIAMSDDLQRTLSVDYLFRKRFKFLRSTRPTSEKSNRRRSHEPTLAVPKIKTGSRDHIPILSNLFHKNENKSMKEKKSFKHNKGLLGAALKNVAMETVQDILATSHSEKQNEKNPLPFSSSAVLNSTNTITSSNPDTMSSSSPANTEIDKGCLSNNNMHASLTPDLRVTGSPVVEAKAEQGHQRTESVGTRMSYSPAKLNSIPCIHRRSSDSDLSITPKGNSLTGSDRSCGVGLASHCMRAANTIKRSGVHQDNFDMLEYPFLTMSKYPQGFIIYLGGAVSARSVKLLERITNLEEPESRDSWWSELRLEIRSHARALNCNAVLGYSETTSICEDVCVLSASGTAAIIGFHYSETGDILSNIQIKAQTVSKDNTVVDAEKDKPSIKPSEPVSTVNKSHVESPEHEAATNHISSTLACSICHLPYGGNSMPMRMKTSKCALCKRGKVPDVLIATIEIPEGLPLLGRGCFIQAYVCRPLRDLRGESNAKEISDGLPFLEYELHRILVSKLKIKGMNAIFGLKVRISIGEKLLVGIVTGTAVFLAPLSPPAVPKLVSDRSTDEAKLAKLQKHLHETVKKNKEIYQLTKIDEIQNGRILSDNDDSDDEQAALDVSIGNKDCCILEVDDPEDAEVVNLLMETSPPDGFHVVNTEFVPGLEELEIVKNLQMFTQIWRAKLQFPCNLDKHIQRLLQSVYFKLRRMIPCALCDLQFRIDLPEPDEIQLCVLGMALGIGDSPKCGKCKRKNPSVKRNDEEMIFNLEEDQIPENSVACTQPTSNQLHTQTLKHRPKSPQRNRFHPTKQRHVPYQERHGVDITPLSYVPGGKIERYLGNFNFFFIRETTSIREEGGLSGFVHSFITEVLAIVRAHVTALGGNAMVAYFMTECILNHNLHKNQGQCLINVGGDVVFVSYYNEES